MKNAKRPHVEQGISETTTEKEIFTEVNQGV